MSCFEEEFEKPSVISGVVGIAYFPSISWLEFHKISKLLPEADPDRVFCCSELSQVVPKARLQYTITINCSKHFFGLNFYIKTA